MFHFKLLDVFVVVNLSLSGLKIPLALFMVFVHDAAYSTKALNKKRENDCGWRTSNRNTSRPNLSSISEFCVVHLNACGIGLVLSPSAHVGSGNHGDMVLIHHGKRHDAYAFILETLMLFSVVPLCGQLGCAALLNCLRLK